jgi:hypothetical protein
MAVALRRMQRKALSTHGFDIRWKERIDTRNSLVYKPL